MAERNDSPFVRNEHGAWCPSCGEQIDGEDLDFARCSACGFPDDNEAMAHFHCGENEDG